MKGRFKHPYSVLVWGGVSRNGKTRLAIFKGIMTTKFYLKILTEHLLPSAQKLYPAGDWVFMQDNGKTFI